MKKIFYSVLSFICALAAMAGTLSAAYAASARSRAIAAYRSALSKKTIKWNIIDSDTVRYRIKTNDMEFALINVNNDNIPELILHSDDADHAHDYYALFTYYKGKMIWAGEMGDDSDYFRYYPRKGIVRSSHNGGGDYTYYSYSVFNGKTAKTVRIKEEQVMDNGAFLKYPIIRYYTANNRSLTNKQISKKAFNRWLKGYVGKTKMKTPKLHKSKAVNWRKYLT